MNKEIIKEIKEKDFLRRVFAFKSDDEKDFSIMFKNKKEIKKYSHINWLYLSDNKYAKLIGIMEYGFVFSIDEDFDIPFAFFRLSVIAAGKPEVDSLAKNNLYRSDLEKYVEWCNKNGFKVEKRDIRLLQDSILKPENK